MLLASGRAELVGEAGEVADAATALGRDPMV